MRKLKAYLRPSLTTFCRNFFLNARKKNGEEYEPATVSSFQRSIQRYLSEKKYPFNILKDNEFEKSRKVLAAKRKSLVHEHGKGNKPQAAQAIDEDEEDALFEAGEFGDSNPIALQRTVTTDHLVSGESTLHQATLFSARSRIFLPLNPVLRGSILLPPRYPSIFARMARWQ